MRSRTFSDGRRELRMRLATAGAGAAVATPLLEGRGGATWGSRSIWIRRTGGGISGSMPSPAPLQWEPLEAQEHEAAIASGGAAAAAQPRDDAVEHEHDQQQQEGGGVGLLWRV